MASDDEIKTHLNSVPGYIGPLGLQDRLVVDYSAAQAINFICGANQVDSHFINANWEDISTLKQADLRNIQEGDVSPDGNGHIQIKRGIEVGHIFQLGNKYSQALGASVLDQSGKDSIITMGCYGIGVSRVIAAAIEQNNDDKGIIWPASLAPFQISLCPVNMHKSPTTLEFSEKLYQQLIEQGYEVLFDDRNVRPGQMFADHELIGIPFRVVVSERGLKNSKIEVKSRCDKDSQDIPIDQLLDYLQNH
jgi:prolyl-tRNA synthetase